MKISEMNVECIDSMGSDLSVVNAARVSFAKVSEFEGTWLDPALAEKDVKLINYLAKHNHWTPFAHAFVSFRIKAPIFVARQLVKHQVGLAWNEVSRRYVDDEPEFWFPKEWRGKPINAKQGSSDATISGYIETEYWGGDIDKDFADVVGQCWALYDCMIQNGVAPEQARMILPQNTMTEWIWSGSLAAFARVCKLRLDPHAQLETQEVAQRIADEMIKLFPVSFKVMLEN